MAHVTRITPFLWFDGQMEEAMKFYTSLFPDSRITSIRRMGPGDDAPAFTAEFTLAGQSFMALNGGPMYRFTEAVSFFVSCADQAEVDRYWSALTADGGAEQMCGWLKDRYGLSWQIIPEALNRCLGDPDPARAKRAMEAMLKMKKIDVAALERAAAG